MHHWVSNTCTWVQHQNSSLILETQRALNTSKLSVVYKSLHIFDFLVLYIASLACERKKWIRIAVGELKGILGPKIKVGKSKWLERHSKSIFMKRRQAWEMWTTCAHELESIWAPYSKNCLLFLNSFRYLSQSSKCGLMRKTCKSSWNCVNNWGRNLHTVNILLRTQDRSSCPVRIQRVMLKRPWPPPASKTPRRKGTVSTWCSLQSNDLFPIEISIVHGFMMTELDMTFPNLRLVHCFVGWH